MSKNTFFTQRICPICQKHKPFVRLNCLEQYLGDHGYAPSTIQRYVGCAEHFENWLASRSAESTELDEAAVALFLNSHLPECACKTAVFHSLIENRAALYRYLTVLRIQGLILPRRSAELTEVDKEVQLFEKHLIETCGLAQNTRIYRMRYVREFLNERYRSDPVRFLSFRPQDLWSFLTERAKGCKPGTAKVIAASLRSYLKFLVLRGLCEHRMTAAVPTIPQWRLASIPKTLSERELEHFLSSFDRSNSTGCRDYAMALCMSELGLRTSEVAQLRLEDVNWREGIIQIFSGKDRRQRIMPLPSHVGEAMAAYVKTYRPKSTERRLFLRHRAPVGPVTTHIVRGVVRRACALVGIAPPRSGPHTLRHTLATRMLRRGVRLTELADVLGHKSIDTTAIYAKVDLSLLSQVALPWPGEVTS